MIVHLCRTGVPCARGDCPCEGTVARVDVFEMPNGCVDVVTHRCNQALPGCSGPVRHAADAAERATGYVLWRRDEAFTRAAMLVPPGLRGEMARRICRVRPAYRTSWAEYYSARLVVEEAVALRRERHSLFLCGNCGVSFGKRWDKRNDGLSFAEWFCSNECFNAKCARERRGERRAKACRRKLSGIKKQMAAIRRFLRSRDPSVFRSLPAELRPKPNLGCSSRH